MIQIPFNTILHTGWGIPAHTCCLEVWPVAQTGSAANRMCFATNREGRFRSIPRLNLDYHALGSGTTRDSIYFSFNTTWNTPDQIETLWMHLWRAWNLAQQCHARTDQRSRQHDTTLGVEPYWVHTTGLPFRRGETIVDPEGDRLMACDQPGEDIRYRVRMDWFFPYTLTSGDASHRTALVPFEIGPSRIHGQTQSGGREIGSPRTTEWVVRFRRVTQTRPGESRPRSIFVTDYFPAVDPLAREPLRTLNGTDESVHLPCCDGFLHLHWLFVQMLRLDQLTHAYNLAQSILARDRHLLAQMNLMFTMARDANRPGATRTHAERATRLARRLDTEIQRRSQESLLADYRRRVMGDGGTGHDHALAGILEYVSHPEFARQWRIYLYRFKHYLGPLTFYQLAAWLARLTPISEVFYELGLTGGQLGRQLLTVGSGAPDMVINENEDPMLLDRRFLNDAHSGLPEAGNAFLKALKSSIKVFTSVNQYYMYQHAVLLVGLDNTHSGLGPLSREPITLHQIKSFVAFVTQAEQNDVNTWVRGLTGSPDPQIYRGPPGGEHFHEMIDDLRFRNSRTLPSITRSMDVIGAAIATAVLVDSLCDPRYRDAWTTTEVLTMASNFLGVISPLAAMIASQSAIVLYGLGPAAAMVGVVIAGRNSLDAFARGDTQTGAMRAMQCIGASLCFAGMIAGFSAVGCVPGTALIITGTALVLIAELAIYIEEHWNEPCETFTRELYRRFTAETAQSYSAARGARVGTVPFDGFIRDYRQAKTGWLRDWNDGGHTLEQVIGYDETWTSFPNDRWHYLLRMGEAPVAERRGIVERYIRHCRGLESSWGPDATREAARLSDRDLVTIDLPPPPALRPQGA